jgi:hypothetical protein
VVAIGMLILMLPGRLTSSPFLNAGLAESALLRAALRN